MHKKNSPIGEPLGEDRGIAVLMPDREGMHSYQLKN